MTEGILDWFLHIEMDERDRTGGRIEREIELGVIGKGRCHGTHKEHSQFS